jgi:hypothetical protein
MTEKIVLCTLVKPEGASRIDSIPGYFQITAQYSRQYPYGEWTGNVHSDKREFITPAFNGKPLTGSTVGYDDRELTISDAYMERQIDMIEDLFG